MEWFFSYYLFLIGIILITTALFYLLRKFNLETVSINFFGFNASFKKTNLVIELSYQIWVEMNSRIVCLPFDENNDLIIDIYKSWYMFFQELRNIEKNAIRISYKDDRLKLIKLINDIMNNIFRPHLTKHYNRFAKWYTNSNNSHPDIDPQQIQKGGVCLSK